MSLVTSLSWSHLTNFPNLPHVHSDFCFSQRLNYKGWTISTSYLPTNTDIYTNSPRQPRLKCLLQFKANPLHLYSDHSPLTPLYSTSASLYWFFLHGNKFMQVSSTKERKGEREGGVKEGRREKGRKPKKQHFSTLLFHVKCISISSLAFYIYCFYFQSYICTYFKASDRTTRPITIKSRPFPLQFPSRGNYFHLL